MNPESGINRYSARWFETFLDTLPRERTEDEVAFLERVVPRERFPRLLDLCCGPGRHALELARRGYEVTGVDRDAVAIRRATAAGEAGTRFVRADVRDIDAYPGTWDGALVMWASFGFFTPAENRTMLEQVARKLRPGGRLVLDVYHRGFFKAHQGRAPSMRGGPDVTETKWLEGDRLRVELAYSDDHLDRLSWQVFDPPELRALASAAGLELVVACSGFNVGLAPDVDRPRMQMVFERPVP